MRVIRSKTIEYGEAWELQKSFFEPLLAQPDVAEEVLILCEHPHVYTLGRSGSLNNMLVDEEFLSKIGATYFKTDRGGDITYHGYGQLVAYPILNLQRHNLSLKEYIDRVEESIILTVAEFGIKAQRLEGATGVWVIGADVESADGAEKRLDRKIAAIGVRASRYITMHGMALNINTDLSYFDHINPCGFVDKGVTSLAAEIGSAVEMNIVENVFIKHFKVLFNC